LRLHGFTAGVALEALSPARVARDFLWYAGWFAVYAAPFPLLAALGWLSGEDRRKAVCAGLFCAGAVVFLSFSPLRFFRYLVPLIPAACALCALALSAVYARSRPAGAALAALLVSTDLLGFPLAAAFPRKLGALDRFHGSPAAGFAYELTHDFSSCDRAVAAALNREARPGDVVVATYGDLPLQFYTKGLRIAGGFQGRKLPLAPDWIVVQPNVLSAEPGKDRDVLRFLAARVDPRLYEQVPLVCESGMLAACPEPWTHEFRVSEKPALKLLRKLRPTPYRRS
jgi:hypothetical protein